MEMPGKRNIFLCGFMGTGKSTVGKRLAAIMHFEFIDMDAVIEEEAGMTIPQIFASQGEPSFRALESQLAERLAERRGCVIAAGGGAIVNPHNLEIMKSCGIVITLSADAETILRRVDGTENRPMLYGGDRFERIQTLMEQRAESYSKADIILDTSSLGIDGVVQNIIDRLQEFGFIV